VRTAAAGEATVKAFRQLQVKPGDHAAMAEDISQVKRMLGAPADADR